MSHFSVMVQVPKGIIVTGGIESYVAKVLEPFDENKELEPYAIKTAEELKVEQDHAAERYPDDGFDNITLAQFAYRWYGQEVDENGNLLSTYNPNSKWDWWTIGGRWQNLLRLKNGDIVTFALVQDIDFDGIREDNRQRKQKRWIEAHQDGTPDDFLKYINGITATTLEDHVATAKSLTTFAVVTKDGEWCEKGKMGWWGIHTATEDEEKSWEEAFHKNFIEPLDPHDVIVIVDCHI